MGICIYGIRMHRNANACVVIVWSYEYMGIGMHGNAYMPTWTPVYMYVPIVNVVTLACRTIEYTCSRHAQWMYIGCAYCWISELRKAELRNDELRVTDLMNLVMLSVEWQLSSVVLLNGNCRVSVPLLPRNPQPNQPPRLRYLLQLYVLQGIRKYSFLQSSECSKNYK